MYMDKVMTIIVNCRLHTRL